MTHQGGYSVWLARGLWRSYSRQWGSRLRMGLATRLCRFCMAFRMRRSTYVNGKALLRTSSPAR